MTPLEPGSIIAERYEILTLVGRGAMALVYKVLDQKKDNQVVALKLLTDLGPDDKITKARFKNEVEYTKNLKHPNIVQVYSFEELSPLRPFIVMEYVEGCSVRKLIYDEENPLEFVEAVRLLRDIACALAHAHEHGIVHRDLKPDNVLLAKDSVVKVVDFGLARNMETGFSLTATGETVGTPVYMAPEQLRGEKADGRTDIYALGILAFEMAAKQRPFEDENYMKLAAMHLAVPLPDLSELAPSIPSWYQDFVEVCAEKKPSGRYKSMKKVAELLDRKLNKLSRSGKQHKEKVSGVTGILPR